jgi:transmembrane sensor
MEVKINHIYEDVFLAKWIANEISDAELKKIVSEDDFLAYQKIKVGIDVFEQLEAPLDDTYQKIQQKIQAQTATNPKHKIISLYSKIVFALAASVLLFFSITKFFGNNYVINQTSYGEQKVVMLLDGSEVIMNAKSELKYDKKNWDISREVSLKGEAFFKVKKGSKFIVMADNGSVTVMGTQFNVNSGDKFFEVICYDGKVKVVSNKKEFILLPNQSVRNDNGLISNEKSEILDKAPSWLYGESSFKSVPLRLVILALEHQFNIQINAKNIDDTIIFTGSLNHKDLNIALASVFKTVQINYTVSGKQVTLYK